MRHIRSILCLTLLVVLTLMAGASRAQDDSLAEQRDDVLQYLDQTIGWYRSIQGMRLGPDSAQEAVILQSVQRDALKVLLQGFDYACAEAAIIEPVAGDDDGDAQPSDSRAVPSKIAAFQKDIANTQAAVQGQLEAVNRELVRAPSAKRAQLLQQREALQGAISLGAAQGDLVAKAKIFLASPKAGDSSFRGAVKALAASFPELKGGSAADPNATAAGAAAAAAGTADKTGTGSTAAARETSGIIAAVSDFFPLWQRRSEIDALVRAIDAIDKTNESLRADLRTDLIAASTRGRQMTAAAGVTLPPTTATATGDQDNAPASAAMPSQTAAPADFDKLTARFKLLSAAVIPLGQQHQALETSRADLVEWRGILTHEFTSSLTRLLFRVLLLCVAVGIPLLISEASRRTANRYIKDMRRRRQLRTMRRGLVSTVIAIVLFMSLFAEVGSLATYVGLLTAGVAVALQQVILSMFAYFFFFGRFGVRVGERVTIMGTTGDVIEVGLLRVYVMEQAAGKPTGRIAVFPNLVFFQPTAFFKQIADTNYSWQEVTLTFTADTDQKALRQKLLNVANIIYAEYHESMARQQAALENATHLKIDIPHPDCLVQVTDKGQVATLRYPVEAGRENEIDKRMNEAVMQAIQADPSLKLVDAPQPGA